MENWRPGPDCRGAIFHCAPTYPPPIHKLILSGYLNLKGVLRSKISLKKFGIPSCITDLLQKLEKVLSSLWALLEVALRDEAAAPPIKLKKLPRSWLNT